LTAARNGLWQTRAPFGYIRVPKSSGGHTLAVYESEAKVVRHAFCLAFDHKKGLSGISRALNKGGHCTRNGKAWRVSAVKKILENPIYMGLARIWTPLDTQNIAESITGIRIPVPRIVSRQLFFSVQRILRDRSPSRGRAEDVKRRTSKRRNH
jgi:site-specific DNA recombinase